VLKDHQSAGVTLALKNLSHGPGQQCEPQPRHIFAERLRVLHSGCGIDAVIRNKAVLHILDGIKGLYHGGPAAKPQFVWEHQTLYFATDPVALDHIGWKVIDDKRVAVGKPRLVDDKPDNFSHFRSPAAGARRDRRCLGLGEWDERKSTCAGSSYRLNNYATDP